MRSETIAIRHPSWTEDRARRVNKAIKRCEEADYRCFLLLREVECWIGEAMDQREQANEDFLHSFCVERRVEGAPAWFRIWSLFWLMLEPSFLPLSR